MKCNLGIEPSFSTFECLGNMLPDLSAGDEGLISSTISLHCP